MTSFDVARWFHLTTEILKDYENHYGRTVLVYIEAILTYPIVRKHLLGYPIYKHLGFGLPTTGLPLAVSTTQVQGPVVNDGNGLHRTRFNEPCRVVKKTACPQPKHGGQVME
jgi:hypothetical protein